MNVTWFVEMIKRNYRPTNPLAWPTKQKQSESTNWIWIDKRAQLTRWFHEWEMKEYFKHKWYSGESTKILWINFFFCWCTSVFFCSLLFIDGCYHSVNLAVWSFSTAPWGLQWIASVFYSVETFEILNNLTAIMAIKRKKKKTKWVNHTASTPLNTYHDLELCWFTC